MADGAPTAAGSAAETTASVGDSDPPLADLSDIYRDRTLVLVGCGSDKRDPEDPVDVHEAVVPPGEPVHKHGETGPAWEARDLYTSTYFQLKRAFAEAVTSWQQGDSGYSCGWAILSAEHGVVQPGRPLTPYDTTISDLGDDPTNEDHWYTGPLSGNGRRPDGREVVTEVDYWARKVGIDLAAWVGGHHDDVRNDPREHQFTLLVLAGQKYLDPLRERGVFKYGNVRMLGDPNDVRFSLPVTPRYLFEEIDAAGIGEQMAWLSDAVDRLEDAESEGDGREQAALGEAASEQGGGE